MNYKQFLWFCLEYNTKLTNNAPALAAEMAHSFLLFFMITQFAGSVQFQSKIDWILRKNIIKFEE